MIETIDSDTLEYMEYVRSKKSVSCKLRDKTCEGYDLPCDFCKSFIPIRRNWR